MLECPGLDVLAEGRIEPILAEYFVSQHLHHESGLLVSDPEEIAHLRRVRNERLFFTGLGVIRVEMERVHLDRVAVRRALKIFRRVAEIDESVEAFIHPRIES